MGRFLNADAFTSTGQGLTGNNMFAYCGNNPASNIDPAGTYYCQVRDNRAVVGGVVSADDLLGLAAGIGIYNLFDEITEKLEKSIAKAKTNKKYRSATETHHIAAKKSYRAAEAKAILTEVLPNGVENPENKIELKTVVHRRIHTNLYYALVNSLVVEAYNSAGNDKLKATENVRGALFVVRVFLEGLDNLVG